MQFADRSLQRRLTGPRYSRRRALAAASVATLASALAGCGRAKPSSSAKNGASAATKPQNGGTLNVQTYGNPTPWEPSLELGTGAQQGMSYCCNRLLGYKSGPGVDYTDLILQPELAQSWESPDARQFTFHLVPGVRFADLPPVNGRLLTSADIKWTYEYLSRTGPFKGTKLLPSKRAQDFAGIEGIETPDDHTVVVRFARSFSPFLSYTGYVLNGILAHEIFDEDGNFDRRILGTGPWQIDQAASQQPDVRVVFTKNPNYWRRGLPYIDEIDMVVVPDVATAAAALEANQVDLLDPQSVTATTVAQIKKARPDVTVQAEPDIAYVLGMNAVKAPSNDARVRKAIDLAIDRDELIKVVGHGQGTLALPAVFSEVFTQEQIRGLIQHDPARAKQLLAEAGYPRGLDIGLTYGSYRNVNDILPMVQLLQAQLKDVGINLQLRPVPDAAAWDSRGWVRDFDIYIVRYPSVLDPDNNLYGWDLPGQTQNYGNVDDPELTALIVKQRQLTDAKERSATIQQAVERILQMEWQICLFHPVVYNAWRPRLRDFWLNVGTQYWPLERSWIGR